MWLSQRRTIAVSLGLFLIAEIVSIFAIGHHHAHALVDAATATASPVAHCSHDHVHACPSHAHQDACAESHSEHTGPAHRHTHDEDCSICRFLTQAAMVVEVVADPSSEVLSIEVVAVESFDVEAPSYLLPLPRSPPSVV